MAAVRDLSRMMKTANRSHLKAANKLRRCMIATPDRGCVVKPNAEWDGSQDVLFVLEGWSNADWANDIENRRSISARLLELCGAVFLARANQQDTVALSGAESEVASVVVLVQDMLHVWRILTSIKLRVESPMVCWCDNKGLVNLLNSWKVAGRTRHVAVKLCFLRELKERGIFQFKWRLGENVKAGLFSKNLARPLFEKHAKNIVGVDEHMKH